MRDLLRNEVLRRRRRKREIRSVVFSARGKDVSPWFRRVVVVEVVVVEVVAAAVLVSEEEADLAGLQLRRRLTTTFNSGSSRNRSWACYSVNRDYNDEVELLRLKYFSSTFRYVVGVIIYNVVTR